MQSFFAAFEYCSIALQVYQVVSTAMATLDNVVELYSRNNLPSLPGLPPNKPIVATIRLRHSLEFQSGSTVQITFESTEVKTTGMELVLPDTLPPTPACTCSCCDCWHCMSVERGPLMMQLSCCVLLACTCKHARSGPWFSSLIQVQSIERLGSPRFLADVLGLQAESAMC